VVCRDLIGQLLAVIRMKCWLASVTSRNLGGAVDNQACRHRQSGEAAVRLSTPSRAQRSGGSRIETVALYTEARAEPDSCASGHRLRLGPASERPVLTSNYWNARSVRPVRRAWVGWVRGRRSRIRLSVRSAGCHVHRPERGGDAVAGRQDRLQADRREGGVRGSVEPRASDDLESAVLRDRLLAIP